MTAGYPGAIKPAIQPLLRIRLFSTMDVRHADGSSLLPKSRKARGVLAVLAMNAGRPVTRDELAALLWSRRERDQARSSLRQAVHELSELLGEIDPELFLADRTHLALGNLHSDRNWADQVWIDTQALSAGNAAMPETFQHGLVEDLHGLDPAFDRWRKMHAERLFGVARGRAENWLAGCQRQDDDSGDMQAVIEAAGLLLRIDPAHERAWRVVIRGHMTSGDGAAARYAYERCADALAAAALGAPSAETLALLSGTDLPPPKDVAYPVRHRPHPVRIGVMPLRNLHGSCADEFSLGLTAEFTYALSAISWLSCVGSSSMHAIAPDPALWKSLALDFLMEGTIQRAEGRVRVMIRLLDLHAGDEIVFAKRFDCQETAILSLQESIAAETVAPMCTVLEQYRLKLPQLSDGIAR